MIGAVAAMAVAYGAEKSSMAQVYDFAMTLKTGVCRDAKVSSATVKFFNTYLGKDQTDFEKGNRVGFRRQSTQKIAGVFWGCYCPTIADPQWRIYSAGNGASSLGGYLFWNQTTETPFVPAQTTFQWRLLNRITDNFKSVEGTWTLQNLANSQAFSFMGAGFGKASTPVDLCDAVITSISGEFAGLRLPGADDRVTNCQYCNVGDCVTVPFCIECASTIPNHHALTAAYGKWSIKFNSRMSTRLGDAARLSSVYTFKKAGAFELANGTRIGLVDFLSAFEDLAAAPSGSTAGDADDDDAEWDSTMDSYPVQGEDQAEHGSSIAVDEYFAKAIVKAAEKAGVTIEEDDVADLTAECEDFEPVFADEADAAE